MNGGASAPSVLSTEHNMDVYITDRIVEWLGGYGYEQPFFLWAGLCAPHGAFDPPAELDEHYRDVDIPLPVGHQGAASLRNDQELYAAQVELIDRQIGRILEALENGGLTDKTLVILTSDHSEMLGDHHKDGKCEPWEASIRVPCVMRWPGKVPAGADSDAMVELVDLLATIHEAETGEPDVTANLPASPGQSPVDHCHDPSAARREHVYAEDGGHNSAQPWTPCAPAS